MEGDGGGEGEDREGEQVLGQGCFQVAGDATTRLARADRSTGTRRMRPSQRGLATGLRQARSTQMVTRIVSGGQTGVDVGALRAGLDAGVGVGGYCPKNGCNLDGPIPSEYRMTPTDPDESDHPLAVDETGKPIPRSRRTGLNVEHSDATLVLRPPPIPGRRDGTTLTIVFADLVHHRPWLALDPFDAGAFDAIVAWLWRVRPSVLNVAGPSEQEAPGIDGATFDLIKRVLEAVNGGKP